MLPLLAYYTYGYENARMQEAVQLLIHRRQVNNVNTQNVSSQRI